MRRATTIITATQATAEMWLFASLAGFMLLWLLVSPLTCCSAGRRASAQPATGSSRLTTSPPVGRFAALTRPP